MTPFFSVIIPTYNRADKLRRALESLERQTCRDFEVIVCDDGSTDDTRDVVSSFTAKMQISYLREDNWGGPARPRNLGIAAARGEWLCFLDADDWWYPEKLEVVLAETGRADLVYHDFDVYTEQGKRGIGKHSRKMNSPVFVELLTRGCSLVTSSVCVRKEILEKSGGFAEERELIAVEDYDLWLRISRLTENFLHIPKILGAYWVDQANISEFSEKYIARETAIFCRHAACLSQAGRDEAERLLAYKTGIARKHLGEFSESRRFFQKAMGSKRIKIRIYARFYFILSLLRSRYTIP